MRADNCVGLDNTAGLTQTPEIKLFDETEKHAGAEHGAGHDILALNDGRCGRNTSPIRGCQVGCEL